MRRLGEGIMFVGIASCVGGLVWFRTIAMSAQTIAWSLAVSAIGLLVALVGDRVRTSGTVSTYEEAAGRNGD
jgi:hypothetical protein